MKTTHIPIRLIFIVFFTSNIATSQTDANNLLIVQHVYEAIQNKDSSKLIADFSSDINWCTSNIDFGETERDNIQKIVETSALMHNEWEEVTFKNLNFQQLESNTILVTGTLIGRLSREDETITSEFKHLWWLKDGKVIKFLQ